MEALRSELMAQGAALAGGRGGAALRGRGGSVSGRGGGVGKGRGSREELVRAAAGGTARRLDMSETSEEVRKASVVRLWPKLQRVPGSNEGEMGTSDMDTSVHSKPGLVVGGALGPKPTMAQDHVHSGFSSREATMRLLSGASAGRGSSGQVMSETQFKMSSMRMLGLRHEPMFDSRTPSYLMRKEKEESPECVASLFGYGGGGNGGGDDPGGGDHGGYDPYGNEDPTLIIKGVPCFGWTGLLCQ